MVDPKLCVVCRGRNWCGLSYCPLIASKLAMLRIGNITEQRELYGSSPPSVFVGRAGYPFINIGPSTPLTVGDTSLYDMPEKWIDLGLEDIISFRMSMVTGIKRVRIDNLKDPFIDKIHELAISIKPVDIEIKLAKPPKPLLKLYEHEPPQGPRSVLESFKITSNPRVLRVVDRVYNDPNIKARDAIIMLYFNGIPISSIQRMLSVGALGRFVDRKIVPTRWSITAVDYTVSNKLIEEIREYPVMSGYRMFVRKHYDNLFIAILGEGKWSFEWMEAWYPGSTWNPGSDNVIIEGDYEGFHGRRSYPSIGGCYYACRLAVAEYLVRERRQCNAIVLREIYPGFNIPIGVWFVRENIRKMFREQPVIITNKFSEIIEIFDQYSRIGFRKWLMNSRLLRRIVFNESLTRFLEKYRE
ncbi:MAG: Nre family DNA repair protein [Desulfurococcaceae archaeon]